MDFQPAQCISGFKCYYHLQSKETCFPVQWNSATHNMNRRENILYEDKGFFYRSADLAEIVCLALVHVLFWKHFIFVLPRGNEFPLVGQ